VDSLSGEYGRAAQYASSLEYGGYDDWFLPSKEELDQMYKNLAKNGLGGFSRSHYWSSSIIRGWNGNSWAQNFSNGDQGSGSFVDNPNLRTKEHKVRAVRSF
jgi:hypothetical protein